MMQTGGASSLKSTIQRETIIKDPVSRSLRQVSKLQVGSWKLVGKPEVYGKTLEAAGPMGVGTTEGVQPW
jgi:hypothetical protein